MRLTTLLFAVVLSACGPRELRVTMNADNNSGQSGFAVIEERGNKLVVTVETSVPDFVGDRGQLAHIHEGNCGEIGMTRAGLSRLNPLEGKPGRFGSTSEVTLSFNDFKTGEWAINAHDERDPLIYVSCGEIPRP